MIVFLKTHNGEFLCGCEPGQDLSSLGWPVLKIWAQRLFLLVPLSPSQVLESIIMVANSFWGHSMTSKCACSLHPPLWRCSVRCWEPHWPMLLQTWTGGLSHRAWSWADQWAQRMRRRKRTYFLYVPHGGFLYQSPKESRKRGKSLK